MKTFYAIKLCRKTKLTKNNIKNKIWSISFIKFIMIESKVHNLGNILVLKEKRKTILQTSFELCVYQILKIHP